MTNKEIKIAYKEFDSIDELESKDRKLAQAAIEATKLSYAPYSNFNVGAAVLFEDGEIVKGSNQENAAYPSGMCAERTALFYASASRPDKAMSAIAIAAGQNGVICDYPVTPCGACRQVILETEKRFGTPVRIILYGTKECYIIEDGIKSLLPLSFNSDFLE
jgi:cytidine deaminase